MAEEPTVPAPLIDEADVDPEDADEALRIVLKKALEVNGVVRGLSETARTLDKGAAHLCVLAEDCEEPAYTNLITALATEHNISLIRVPERKTLGEYAGLVKYDKDKNVKKIIGTSSVAITNFGEQTKALTRVIDQLKKGE
eukprot:343669_1